MGLVKFLSMCLTLESAMGLVGPAIYTLYADNWVLNMKYVSQGPGDWGDKSGGSIIESILATFEN